MKDYYKILDLGRKASPTDIKKQFRIKALLTHPDKTNKNTTAEFIDVYEAYAVLSDKRKRNSYDGLYDLFFSSVSQTNEEELKIDLKQIEEQAKIYAKDFKIFDKEILGRLLFDLFLSADGLLFASCITTFFGLWTICRGLFALDLGYSLVGIVVTLIGLFLGRMKINRVIRNDY